MNRSLLALLALAALGLAPSAADAYGYGHGYRGVGYGFGPRYTTTYVTGYTWNPYVETYWDRDFSLSKEDRYDGARKKGDRFRQQGRFDKAVAQYKDAYRRAVRFWGPEDSRSKKAAGLIESARAELLEHGSGKHTQQYRRARDRADDAMDRGQFERAQRLYRQALASAHRPAQAQEASARLVRAEKAANREKAPTAPAYQMLARRGQEALRGGRSGQAVELLAQALPQAIRVHGAASPQARRLTEDLARAQRQLQAGALDYAVAE